MKNPKNTTIIRFPIDLNATTQVLAVPANAEFINLGPDIMRGMTPALWFAADLEAEKEIRTIARLQTGQESPYPVEFLGFLGTTIALGNSTSQPGTMTPRTVHFFEATGEAREQIIALHEATATADTE
jgi:hypothetical protein